jgi:hypothetical protein
VRVSLSISSDLDSPADFHRLASFFRNRGALASSRRCGVPAWRAPLVGLFTAWGLPSRACADGHGVGLFWFRRGLWLPGQER